MRPRLLAVLACLLAIASSAREASACGAFARRAVEDPYATTPYLAVEQTLILWDRATRTEDFIREARFASTREPFGFVVPTPSKPEVSKVTPSPFPTLRKEFPHSGALRPAARGGGGGPAGGGGGRPEPPQVEVLSVQRVGSFDVTVLRASDSGALDRWLAENGFAMTDEARPWLTHYVDLHFFFVAFKFGGAPPGAADGMTSETVRIRFETPAPYYPYLEPEHAPAAALIEERLLSAWLVTAEPMLPVVAHTKRDGWTWQRPWNPGGDTQVLTANFLARLPALEQDFPIRAKNVWVQAFRDTRASRRNLGDIVFAYRTPTELSAEETAALRSLLPVLDERIPFSEAPAAKKKLVACAGAATVGGGGPAADDAAPVGVLVVVSLLVLARRRPGRAAALAALVIVSAATTLSCRRSGLATGSDPRERAVVELLAGKPPYRIVPAAEPELVTTVTIDGLASSPADLPVAADVERARARIGDCLRVQLPEPVAVEVEFGADDNVKAARVPALKNADVRARVEGCWKNMWFEKKSFAPGSTARVSFRMTLKHELRE